MGAEDPDLSDEGSLPVPALSRSTGMFTLTVGIRWVSRMDCQPTADGRRGRQLELSILKDKPLNDR